MSPAGARPLRTLAVLAFGTTVYAISQTMVIPALPAMQRTYAASPADVGWVMSVFFIASAVCTGIASRLGDIFGKRRVFVIALLAYGTGALICAVTDSLALLVAGRAVTGIGGAAVPLAYAIARDTVPGAKVSVALATIAMTIGLGAGIGMVLGGVIADGPGFHWSFALAAIMSGVAVAAALLVVPASTLRTPASVDYAGAALLTVGLGGLLLAISRAGWWPAVQTAGLAGAGLAVLAGMLAFERGRPEPMLHVPTLVHRPVLNANLASLTMGGGQIAASILVVQYAQVPAAAGGPGKDAAHAALFLLPYSALMVLGAQVAGRLALRTSARAVLIAGGALAAGGTGILAVVDATPFWLFVAPGVSGFGISMVLVACPLILARTVDRRRAAEANGTSTIARNVGQSLGAQATAAVIAANVVAGGGPGPEGFQLAFALSAGACALTIVFGLRLPRDSVQHAPGVHAQGLAGRAVAASEGDDLVGDVVPVGRAT